MSDAPLPDVLVITARHEESVAADRAELLVTVHGSSLVTGRAALKKTKEVSIQYRVEGFALPAAPSGRS